MKLLKVVLGLVCLGMEWTFANQNRPEKKDHAELISEMSSCIRILCKDVDDSEVNPLTVLGDWEQAKEQSEKLAFFMLELARRRGEVAWLGEDDLFRLIQFVSIAQDLGDRLQDLECDQTTLWIGHSEEDFLRVVSGIRTNAHSIDQMMMMLVDHDVIEEKLDDLQKRIEEHAAVAKQGEQ